MLFCYNLVFLSRYLYFSAKHGHAAVEVRFFRVGRGEGDRDRFIQWQVFFYFVIGKNNFLETRIFVFADEGEYRGFIFWNTDRVWFVSTVDDDRECIGNFRRLVFFSKEKPIDRSDQSQSADCHQNFVHIIFSPKSSLPRRSLRFFCLFV